MYHTLLFNIHTAFGSLHVTRRSFDLCKAPDVTFFFVQAKSLLVIGVCCIMYSTSYGMYLGSVIEEQEVTSGCFMCYSEHPRFR